MREMIFFLQGRPSALLAYQTSLTAVSLASEPKLVKKTLLICPGAIATSRSARSIAGSFDLWANEW